ncbi:hypothetical protein ACFOOL_06795 [Devosia honganensis]|uniref:Uncharacterized protein n=1 Tax=Devosia honganensis TaxID=1610527 RepID=A0ABV7X1L8_9HYPH
MTTITVTPAGIDRIALSEQVIERWEDMLALGALSSENLRLVENEISILADYRGESPEKIDDLLNRYQAIADQLRRMVN